MLVLLRLVIGVFAVSLADQASKWFMLRSQGADLMHGFLALQTVRNDGIAFSLPVKGLLLVAMTAIVLVMLGIFFARRIDLRIFPGLLAGSFIIGGGVGNLIDRIARGHVIDFIAVWRFPVFNVADAAVTVGTILLILSYHRIRLPRLQHP